MLSRAGVTWPGVSVIILLVVLVYTWILEPVAPGNVRFVPVVCVLGLAAGHSIRTGEWGVRGDAFAPALRLALLLTGPAVVVLLAAGAALGTLHARGNPWGDLAYLLFWGAGQQFVLQTTVFRDVQRRSGRAAVWLAPAMFAALHLPNPFLAPVTFVAACGWCRIYDRHPNILPLALSHALGTLAVLHAFDQDLTGRLRVGYSYLLFHWGQ